MDGNRSSFEQKRKSCPYKTGMNRLQSYESSNLLLWKLILWKTSTKTTRFFQLPTYPTTGEVFHQYLPTVRIRRSILSKLNDFSRCRYRYAAPIKPKSLLMILQSLPLILTSVRKMIVYQIVARFSKELFLSMTLCTSLMKRTSWLM